MTWILDNLDAIFIALAAIHAAAVAITNLTPTPADDAVVSKVYRWIEVAAGVVTRRAKELPGESAGE